MSRILSFFKPYLTYLKIGAWVAVGILVGWLFTQKGYYQGKYLKAEAIIEQQQSHIDAWKRSQDSLLEFVRDQNKSIDLLKDAKDAAEKRALEAIKKAQPRVQARQATINKPPAPADGSMTCDEAVAKAVSDLEGSDL